MRVLNDTSTCFLDRGKADIEGGDASEICDGLSSFPGAAELAAVFGEPVCDNMRRDQAAEVLLGFASAAWGTQDSSGRDAAGARPDSAQALPAGGAAGATGIEVSPAAPSHTQLAAHGTAATDDVDAAVSAQQRQDSTDTIELVHMLKEALKRTDPARKHVCQVCGKAYSGSRDLKDHYGSAHGQYCLHCDYCGKGFTRATKLELHMKDCSRRNGSRRGSVVPQQKQPAAQRPQLQARAQQQSAFPAEKPPNAGVCELCGKDCRQMSYLRDHLGSAHQVYSFFCPHCGKGFARASRVEKHIRGVHRHLRGVLEELPRPARAAHGSERALPWGAFRRAPEYGAGAVHPDDVDIYVRGSATQWGAGGAGRAGGVRGAGGAGGTGGAGGAAPRRGRREGEDTETESDEEGLARRADGALSCSVCGAGFWSRELLARHAASHLGPHLSCDECSFATRDPALMDAHALSHRPGARRARPAPAHRAPPAQHAQGAQRVLECEKCGRRCGNLGALTVHRDHCRAQSQSFAAPRADAHARGSGRGAGGMGEEEEEEEEEDDEALFAVEALLSRRVKRGKVEYRVRWKGYTPSDDTWELEDQVRPPSPRPPRLPLPPAASPSVASIPVHVAGSCLHLTHLATRRNLVGAMFSYGHFTAHIR